MAASFEHYHYVGGAVLSEDYPYTSGDMGVVGDCVEDEKPKVFTTTQEAFHYTQPYVTWAGSEEFYDNDYDPELFLAALRNGAVTVGTGMGDEFYWYDSGIYTGPCDMSEISHAMTAVGYGFDEETELQYIIIRNSWGEYWGEGGYVRVAMGEPRDGGTCMVYSWSVYPEMA